MKQESIEQRVQALEAFISRKEELRRTTPLRYLFWESTLRCNLSCQHCGSDCLRDDASQDAELDSETIKRELRCIAQHYDPTQCTFAIIGGEPLLRQDCIAVGAYAASLGFRWGITTNGMLLSREVIKGLKEAGLVTISVSLDGVPADHDRLRRHDGSAAIVSRAIQDLLADRFYSVFDVICCVSKINIGRLEPFLAHLVRLGVPAVRFTPVFARGRAGRNSGLMLNRQEYRRLLRFVSDQRVSQSAIKVSLSEEGYWGPAWECVVRDEFHYCGSGVLIGSILHDGRVTGCPSVSRKFIEGNVRETPFVEIWQKRFARYRQDRRQTFPQECSDCSHWDLCEGGGFHLLDPSGQIGKFCSLDKIGEGK